MGQASILILGALPATDREMRGALIEAGFGITDARNVEDAMELVRCTKFDLLLLNLDLPVSAGIRICQEIRTLSGLGIILLAPSTAERDMVEALLAGADDYLSKPLRIPELLARIRAVLRRSSDISRLECNRLRMDGVEVDFVRRRVRVGNREERLTPKEFDVLRYLAIRANKTVGHRELLQAVWGFEYGSTEQCLRGCVAKLRKKIEPSPNQPKYLLTVPWVGYRLLLPD
jgi:two-component system KDP operon response regulator KdpE